MTAPVIVIDDDIDDCNFLAEAFRELKVPNPLLSFQDADKAFDHLNNATVKPFFIICDVNMPKINGLQLRQKINENERLRLLAVPFLFWSTSGSKTLVNEAYSLNVQGFFKKPNDLKDLKHIVSCAVQYWTCCNHPTA